MTSKQSSTPRKKQQVALFLFETRGLWVTGELLGASWFVERDDYGMVVSLPSEQNDLPPFSGAARFGFKVGITIGDAVIAATVDAIQVAVWVESAASFDHPPPHSDGHDGQRELTKASKTALAVAEDFLAWLRVLAGQHWLGMSHERPRHTGTADLIDLEVGKRIQNINWQHQVTLTAFSEDDALDQRALDEIAERVNQGRQVPEADLLLADARNTLMGPGTEITIATSKRDVRRAVLLAAIASEMKIRDTLREKTPQARRELVDLLLTNYRDVDIAIGELPHKAMRAAVGRSLHDEHPELFNAIKRLFKLRNDIAHRGATPSLSETQEVVIAAVELSGWLDSLEISSEVDSVTKSK
jgi:hypothetical protein